VEYHVLEFMGLDPGSWLTIGDFAFQASSLNRSCVARESIKPPPFSGKISGLAPILGESLDSSLGLGFDRRGEISVISGNPERFPDEKL
jgi:hypothetical protein